MSIGRVVEALRVRGVLDSTDTIVSLVGEAVFKKQRRLRLIGWVSLGRVVNAAREFCIERTNGREVSWRQQRGGYRRG